MPTLDFKGKQFVYAHHHTVPFRELAVDKEKSLSKAPSMDDNLIIQGDNLHALKALLPLYAGKVKCIYIDPPYNTGNEGWCYNDNVNAPVMREWLQKNANPVDKEDMERHDKWLCMMWPRLQLLRELLADDGVIFVSIDDNEVHHLRAAMDEIFGEGNFITNIIWEKRFTRNNDAKLMSSLTEHVLLYRKSDVVQNLREPRTEKSNSIYTNPDNDPRGKWTSVSYISQRTKEQRKNLAYDLINPITGDIVTHPTNSWKYSEEQYKIHSAENRLHWGKDGNNSFPRLKRYLSELNDGIVPVNLWNYKETGTVDDGTKIVSTILGKDVFDYPKPVSLIKRVLTMATLSTGDKDAIILDSFAGSGTTAHATLALNKEDGGNRKFILVEMEDYANTITAKRVRRVIKGVPTAKDEALKEGLGGSFTYCTLEQEINIDGILTGENLPSREALARYVFYTATGQSLNKLTIDSPDYYIGETDQHQVFLLYQPDIAFLRGKESALDATKVETIASKRGNKPKLVFATAKYMGQKELNDHRITFCQLPYAIHKVAA